MPHEKRGPAATNDGAKNQTLTGAADASSIAENRTDADTEAVGVAQYLANHGVPIFLAKPALDESGEWIPDGGHNGCGYWLPSGWQDTIADASVLDRWRPGMAVCAVMGELTAALDVDPRNGGDASAAALAAGGMWPTSYGTAATPSGGSHDLIATLGVASLDNTAPGIDIKDGYTDESGKRQGRGFIFIAPTVKLSKATGEIAQYRWTTWPVLPEAEDMAADDTGEALAELVRTQHDGRATEYDEPEPYAGPAFADMDVFTQSQIQAWVNGAVRNVCEHLQSAADWPIGHRPEGKGWERTCADAAWRLGRLARATWSPLTIAEARAAYMDAAPTDSGWTADHVAEKWASQHRRKAPAPWPESMRAPEPVTRVTAEPVSLTEVHDVFTRWLGDDYDLDVLDAVLCTAAAEQLPGDPAWLLVVSGSGAAKTETVAALAGAGATITSTVSSEGALLSGTSKRERTKDATGGLLRKIGTEGVLVIKDVTSILFMQRETRAGVLAALREVYDGFWERNLGSDGGRTLTWQGRLGVVGAVTTAWDAAHAVVAAMGDRFVLVRLDSAAGRQRSGRQAMANAGNEETMRAELSNAVGGLLANLDTSADMELSEAEEDRLLGLADIVTLARTAVERDYRGDVIDCHAPEMPTRFAKQLTMIMRGGLIAGMERAEALRIACRCARDSAPPLRLSILLDLLEAPSSTTHAVRKRLGKPRATVDRELQALHMLGLLVVDEIEDESRGRTSWYYSIADGIDTDSLASMGSARFVSTGTYAQREEGKSEARVDPDISGTRPAAPTSGAGQPADFYDLPGFADPGPERCSECGNRAGDFHMPSCSRAEEVAS